MWPGIPKASRKDGFDGEVLKVQMVRHIYLPLVRLRNDGASSQRQHRPRAGVILSKIFGIWPTSYKALDAARNKGQWTMVATYTVQ
jgi:hypothetical protein